MLMVYGWIILTVLAVLSGLSTLGVIAWLLEVLDHHEPTAKTVLTRWACTILGILVTFSLAFAAWACNHYAYYG